MEETYPRFVEHRVQEALDDTRVVLLCGPRQAGKTTLSQRIADNDDIPFFTLDDSTVLEAVSSDPVGFVRGFDRVVIDEVHRVPGLILAIKATVDADPRPGRFLLTGSANLMKLPYLEDSLAGRMETIRLLPLAQAELRRSQPSLLDKVFSGELPKCTARIVGLELAEAVVAGGYPEALARPKWRRRQNWHLNYAEAIIQRDVRDVARIEQMHVMPRLLAVLAEHSGHLVNFSGIGAKLGMNHVTTQKYVGVFESLFIVHALKPWYSNNLKRLIKSPKLHFLDSGLLATLKNFTPDSLIRERARFGPLLESFVFGEILKLASWSDERYMFSHFRDKERNEVDIVIENRKGQVVGIEVKASATVSNGDFSGLHRLAAACGDRFVLGLVLYDHDQLVSFGNRMAAAPVSTLWS